MEGAGVRQTPLVPSPWLARHAGTDQMLLKLENQQVTGSFKARGAVNKVSIFVSWKSGRAEMKVA